jgi:dsRNA-specific ribonuclease
MDNPNNQLANREKIEHILNYFENIGDNNTKLKINNLEYYQRAFVHESYYQSVQNTVINKLLDVEKAHLHYIPCESNERLEYLGDHILKAIMGKYLFERFGQEREGFLTKLKIKIEKCSMLHQFGLTLGFKKLLLLSLQVENQTILDLDRGRNTPSYYEDAFEAFIGSIMLDFNELGYIYAERFVRSVIENVIDFAEIISKNDNFKDSLQRYFQSLKWKTPTYTSLNEEGPLYRTVFTRMLTINQQNFDQLDQSVKNTIVIYTQKILENYKTTKPDIFMKLFNMIHNDNNYILGIGFGRKVINAEQDCAKQSLLNLNLDLNF